MLDQLDEADFKQDVEKRDQDHIQQRLEHNLSKSMAYDDEEDRRRAEKESFRKFRLESEREVKIPETRVVEWGQRMRKNRRNLKPYTQGYKLVQGPEDKQAGLALSFKQGLAVVKEDLIHPQQKGEWDQMVRIWQDGTNCFGPFKMPVNVDQDTYDHYHRRGSDFSVEVDIVLSHVHLTDGDGCVGDYKLHPPCSRCFPKLKWLLCQSFSQPEVLALVDSGMGKQYIRAVIFRVWITMLLIV
jgi:hypothetical protein